MRKLDRAIACLLAYLLPDACIACEAALDPSERHLCERCRASIRAETIVTALPGRDAAAAAPAVCTSAFRFQGAVRQLVHSLKYGGRVSVAPELARLCLFAVRQVVSSRLLMCPAEPESAAVVPLPNRNAPLTALMTEEAPRTEPEVGPVIDGIVPVPLHHARARERGFNQSELIARELSSLLAIPCFLALRRVAAGRPQASLPRDRRLASTAGAFSAVEGRAEGLRLLLVDDVVTTGATLAEASDALVRGGALSVDCFAVAATPASS